MATTEKKAHPRGGLAGPAISGSGDLLKSLFNMGKGVQQSMIAGRSGGGVAQPNKDSMDLVAQLLGIAPGAKQQLVQQEIEKKEKKQIAEAVEQNPSVAMKNAAEMDKQAAFEQVQSLPEEERNLLSALSGTQPAEGTQTQDSQQQAAPQLRQPTSPFTKQTITPEGDIQLGGFLDFSGQSIEKMAVLQKLLGQEPLQKGEREQLDIQAQNEFFKSIATSEQKPLSAESSKLLSNVNSGLEQLNLLSSQLEENPGLFKELATPGNATAQNVRVMVDDLSDIIGRLRSGGAINKDEEKRFLRQLPKIGVGAFFENQKTAKFKIEKLRKLMSDVRSTVSPRTPEMANRVNAALQAGFSREEIFNRLKEKGSI